MSWFVWLALTSVSRQYLSPVQAQFLALRCLYLCEGVADQTLSASPVGLTCPSLPPAVSKCSDRFRTEGS